MSVIFTNQQEAALNTLYRQGFTNREITKELSVHHEKVGRYLRVRKLKANGTTKKSIQMVDEHRARCSKCKEIKPVDLFLLNRRNAKYPYRLSYCNRCRLDQVNRSLRTSIERFLGDRYQRLKRRCAQEGIPIEIDAAYLVSLYNRQEGKCFYTDIPLEWDEAQGLHRNALSIDKIIPSRGYIKGNVVLCIQRVNLAKNDFSLDEMKEWLPGWYQRIVDMWRELGVACFQVAPGDF
jgi:hypothetical protein